MKTVKCSAQPTSRVLMVRLYIGIAVAVGSFLAMALTDVVIIFLIGYPVGVLIAASDWIIRKIRR